MPTQIYYEMHRRLRAPYGPDELYHMYTDPEENHDLINDPACQPGIYATEEKFSAVSPDSLTA